MPSLQNSRHKSVSRLLRGAGLIIAGVLLLGHTAVIADSYIKVWEKGVVYYYYSGRKTSLPKQATIITPGSQRVRITPPPRGVFPGTPVFSREADQPLNLRPLAIKAVMRMESNRTPKAASPGGAPDLRGLRLGKANDSQVANSFDLQGNMWTGSRYLGRLLTRIGYRSPLDAVAHNFGPRRLDCPPDLPSTREIQALVREVCHNYLKSAQEEQVQLVYARPGVERFAKSNDLVYCFPVAPPYSFRDTWGDSRSGGRLHRAVDIFAADGTPIYAITAGVINTLNTGPESGISLFLQGQDGKGYGYMHLQEYAEGIVEGRSVKKGELIAYVGHTGVKESSAHLHLQVYPDHQFNNAELLNPYGLLVQLCNGKGVTDLFYPNLARQRIPTTDLLTHGTVNLPGSVPSRYQSNQRRPKNAGTWLTNSY